MPPEQYRKADPRKTTVLGEVFGVYKVYDASGLPDQLPPHAIVIGRTPADLSVMKAQEKVLEAREQLAAAKVIAAVGVGQLVNMFAGGITRSGQELVGGAPIAGPLTKVDFGSAVNVPGVLGRAGTGLADLGAVGAVVGYVQANDTLDAQRTLNEQLANALASASGQSIETSSSQQQGDVNGANAEGDGPGAGTRLKMPPMWARDP